MRRALTTACVLIPFVAAAHVRDTPGILVEQLVDSWVDDLFERAAGALEQQRYADLDNIALGMPGNRLTPIVRTRPLQSLRTRLRGGPVQQAQGRHVSARAATDRSDDVVEDNDAMQDEEELRAAARKERIEEKQRQLREEVKYPFKFPLLAFSVIIGGKGLSEAFITAIKVSIGFKGASLFETFAGVPVLAIYILCIVIGVLLFRWTWTTMRG